MCAAVCCWHRVSFFRTPKFKNSEKSIRGHWKRTVWYLTVYLCNLLYLYQVILQCKIVVIGKHLDRWLDFFIQMLLQIHGRNVSSMSCKYFYSSWYVHLRHSVDLKPENLLGTGVSAFIATSTSTSWCVITSGNTKAVHLPSVLKPNVLLSVPRFTVKTNHTAPWLQYDFELCTCGILVCCVMCLTG